MSDDLSLIVNQQSISGWTDIRVTRGIERCPSDFSISLTELFPGELDAVVVKPGDACQIKIGTDVVITGYIDRFVPAISASQHSIHVIGRGKCQDLVDCAAQWPSNQISGASVIEIAQKLANFYGIKVSGLPGLPIPQININYGETTWEIIERLCRYSALLPYELGDGSLYLANVGERIADSGFTEGINVQAATIEYSMDQRFSEYRVYPQSIDVTGDIGDGGFLVESLSDTGVPRPRVRVIISEQGDSGLIIAKQRAVWEMNRRAGHSQIVRLTTDSWRDSAGLLWEPNTLVKISIPTLKLPDVTWVVGEVTYKRDVQGTTADLTVMAPASFNPEPYLLFPVFRDVTQ